MPPDASPSAPSPPDPGAAGRSGAVVAEGGEGLEGEGLFRTLVDHITQLAWMADGSGSIVWYNRRWHEYTGTTHEEVVGWGWRRVHHPDHVDRVVERLARCFETGEPWEDTFPLRGADGRYRWFLSRALPIRDEGGAVVRWFGTNTDVTERLALERSLRELNETLEARVAEQTGQVRELARALTLAEQAERRRLAHLLHDDLQQRLHGLSFTHELLRRQLEAPEALGLLARAEAALSEAATLTRTLSHELSPPLLQGGDLAELLEWLAERKRQRYGLEVETEVRGAVSIPDEAVRVLVYRLLQELLFNVAKHAGTRAARVVAECADAPPEAPAAGRWVRLEVSDEGAGFDPAGLREGRGLGLATVRERLALVGGRLTVDSSPGAGTRVTVEVPTDEPA